MNYDEIRKRAEERIIAPLSVLQLADDVLALLGEIANIRLEVNAARSDLGEVATEMTNRFSHHIMMLKNENNLLRDVAQAAEAYLDSSENTDRSMEFASLHYTHAALDAYDKNKANK